MPNFAYVAKTRGGQEQSGVLAAASTDQAIDELHHKGLIVLHVDEESDFRGRSKSWRERLNQPAFGSGVSTRSLALFTRQLSTLFDAGIPLVRGLRGLSKDESSRVLSRTVGQVADRVEQGSSLAEAFAEHPRVFNSLFVSMTRAGEGAGTLSRILQELAVYLEKVDAIKTKIRSAMSYPSFVLIFAVAISLFLVLKIVPTFEDIYKEFGADLPDMTQWLMGVSRLIRDNLLVTVFVVFLLFAGFWAWQRTRTGRYAKDWFLIHVPLFGIIIKKATLSRMNRTLGILLQSGLPVLEALELTKGATGNAVLEEAIDKVKERVAQGEELTPAFRSTGRMPEMVLQLLGTGEESGEVDAMLLKSAEFYDRQVEASVQGLTSLIEPVLIIVVGGIVGIVVVAMFLPIFYLGDAVMKGGYGY